MCGKRGDGVGEEKEDSVVRVVPFSPSTSFASFVQRMQPAASFPRYEVKPGELLWLDQAMKKAGGDCRGALVIDEINRANLPEVLGPLYTTLSNPKLCIKLPFDQRPFKINESLSIIGTMNQ